MKNQSSIAVIIPALNEAQSIPLVLDAVPAWVDRVIVVDNGSSDETAAIASSRGAVVVHEPARGYGAACMRGIAAAADFADILVFLDADYSDFPEQMIRLVDPIARGEADMVIGSRTLGRRERGALTTIQRFGNALSCFLIRRLWRHGYSDLGPFRAIRRTALDCLRMSDRTYGWTIQMQIRAVQAGLRVREVPVDYRRRIGRSKISGTVRGVVGAGLKILATVARERLQRSRVFPYPVRAEHLIIFSRFPAPGESKTRLIPTLGVHGAAQLHRGMTAHTLLTVEQLRFARDVSAEVRFTGASQESMAACFGDGHTYLHQGDGDLGARMHRAVSEACNRGAERVVVIGTDCPSIDCATLSAAFEALCTHDSVMGPASDGGYYLIGLRRPCGRLFVGVEWGTESVLTATIQRAAAANLSVHQLMTKSDVDLPSDLSEWERHRRPRISVIIPAINEAEQLHDVIASVRDADGIELIVVDGGSTDDTTRIAEGYDARVIGSAAGRAMQMNAGAAAASGEVLLFLHADTCLPPGYAEEVERLLATPHTMLAAFRLGIEHSRFVFRITEMAANFRSRWLGMPFGDQAPAIRATDFYRLGGFREIPIMEDYDFVRRAGRVGRVGIARARVQTSPRRWLQAGWLRLTLIHQACIFGYRVGISPTRIAAWRSNDADVRFAASNFRADNHQPTLASIDVGEAGELARIQLLRDCGLTIHNQLEEVTSRKQ